MAKSKRPLFTVEGGARLRKTLREAGSDLEDLKAANKQAADIAATAAKARTPKLTGRLAGDIRASGTKTAGTIRAGRKRIPYAGPIHWGWPARNIEPSMYLTEGARGTESIWVPLYQELVDEALNNVKGK